MYCLFVHWDRGLFSLDVEVVRWRSFYLSFCRGHTFSQPSLFILKGLELARVFTSTDKHTAVRHAFMRIMADKVGFGNLERSSPVCGGV